MAEFSEPQAEQQELAQSAATARRHDNENLDNENPGADRRAAGETEIGPLFPADQSQRLDRQWQEIQAGFVDSPHASVQKADALVSTTIDAMAASFAGMRNALERTWEKDSEVSTEELRRALQSYRSFFRRLLSV